MMDINLTSKHVYGRLLLIASILLLTIVSRAQSPNAPNIIVFIVDDMGWLDTSVPFAGSVTANNKKYHTPNMERLAKEGMIFTDAYAAPVCTPSRVSLMTGMNVAHHHVTNWTHPLKNTVADAKNPPYDYADWNINGFSPIAGIEKTVHATALPQLLKAAGYFTIHVGKAHWGAQGTPGANPYNLGFIVNVAGHAAGHPQSYLSEDNYGNIPGSKVAAQAVPDLEEYYQTGTFLTEALTREALKSLEYPVAKKQPFFLHFAHYAVHTPLMADVRYFQKYLDRGLDSAEAKYASLIEGMDKSLGDVIDFIEQKGIKNNTVIFFLSDNGGLSLPPRGDKPLTHNAPLKAGKGSVYEGGIRIPFIVSYPKLVKKGQVSHTPIIIEDLFPTLLDITGMKNYKTIQKIDGRSLVPQLKEPSLADTSRILLWHYPNYWRPSNFPGTNYHSALRQHNWKLVYNQQTRNAELYDLSTDIGEQKDLSTIYPHKTKELVALLGKLLKAYNAPMPKDKVSGKPLPYPADVE